jgi:hypothetical protein
MAMLSAHGSGPIKPQRRSNMSLWFESKRVGVAALVAVLAHSAVASLSTFGIV